MRKLITALFCLISLPTWTLGQNEPPTAVAVADRTTVFAGDEVCFDASQSHDPENGPLTYAWTLTHGSLSTEVAFCHRFDAVGSYTVALRVTDDQGASDIDFITITVDPPAGACCTGSLCTTVPAAACAGVFRGAGTNCGAPDNLTTCCPANFNGTGGLSVQDIFDYLAAYFSDCTAAGVPPCYGSADFNASGVIGVQDIFDYLAAYFAGCS